MRIETLKRNNVKVSGEGTDTIMFVHGFGCDQHMWRFITPAFEQNYQIILIDLVGSGQSDIRYYDFIKYDSLKGYADDIIEVCQLLELENIVFVGHSVSAMIGAKAAVKMPHLFKKMVMVTPSPRYLNDTDYTGGFTKEDIDELLQNLDANYLGWSSAMAPLIMGNPHKPELTEELTNSFCRNNPSIAKHFARVTFLSDDRADVKKLNTETLIIQCSQDSIAPQQVGEYLHRHIKNSCYHLMEATGHCPHLSEPNKTIQAIKDFINN